MEKMKADGAHLVKCVRMAGGQQLLAKDVFLAVTPSKIVEIACPETPMEEATEPIVLMEASMETLESMEGELGDPNALRLQFTGVSGTRVYRMGAAKSMKLMGLLQAHLVDQIIHNDCFSPSARSHVRANRMHDVIFKPRKLLCALDFDRTITQKDFRRSSCISSQRLCVSYPDLSSVIGSHRIMLLTELCKYLNHRGVILVVVSLNSRKAIEQVLKKLGVSSLFKHIYDKENVVSYGDKQKLMQHLMAIYGMSAEDSCLLVDDQESNLVAAPCSTLLVREGRGVGARECRQIIDWCRGLVDLGA